MWKINESKLNAFRHRLSSVLKADYIYVVMDGEIVEEGTHSSLILKKGKYQELWSKQMYSKEHIDRPNSHCASYSVPYANTINTSLASKLNKKAGGKFSKSNIGSILHKNSECKLDKLENDSTRQVSVHLMVKRRPNSYPPTYSKFSQALKQIIKFYLGFPAISMNLAYYSYKIFIYVD